MTITGGEVALNGNGDGLDSNGSVNMTGGTVYVDGPIENNNGHDMIAIALEMPFQLLGWNGIF